MILLKRAKRIYLSILILSITLVSLSPARAQEEKLEIFKSAQMLIEEEDYEVAIAKLLAYIDTEPEEANKAKAFYWIGQAYEGLRRWTQAVGAYERALRTSRRVVESVYAKDRISYIKGNYPIDYGPLFVLSTPKRADVFIDGEEKGKTPLFLFQSDELIVGEHLLEVVMNGYEGFCDIINTKIEETVTIEVELKPLWATFYSVPESATLFIDGRLLGMTPVMISLADSSWWGTHELRMTKEGYRDWKSEVILTGETPVEITGKLELIPIVYVRSIPSSAQLYLDGKLLGETPLSLALVDKSLEGVHHLKVVKEGYEEWEEEVVLGEEHELSLQVKLRKVFKLSEVGIENFLPPEGRIDRVLMADTDDDRTDEVIIAYRTRDADGEYRDGRLMIIGWSHQRGEFVEKWQSIESLGDYTLAMLEVRDINGDGKNDIITGTSPLLKVPKMFVYTWNPPSYYLLEKITEDPFATQRVSPKLTADIADKVISEDSGFVILYVRIENKDTKEARNVKLTLGIYDENGELIKQIPRYIETVKGRTGEERASSQVKIVVPNYPHAEYKVDKLDYVMQEEKIDFMEAKDKLDERRIRLLESLNGKLDAARKSSQLGEKVEAELTWEEREEALLIELDQVNETISLWQEVELEIDNLVNLYEDYMDLRSDLQYVINKGKTLPALDAYNMDTYSRIIGDLMRVEIKARREIEAHKDALEFLRRNLRQELEAMGVL